MARIERLFAKGADRGPLGRLYDIVADTVDRFLPLIINHDVHRDPLASDDKIYLPQAR